MIHLQYQTKRRTGMMKWDSRSQRDVKTAERRERAINMVKAENRVKLPKFNAGEAYFLSHKSGAPVRIVIEAVYRKSTSKEWMYCIYSEANGCKPTYVSESILSDRVSKHSSPVYKMPDIVKRIEDGFRFAGNYEKDDAIARGEEFARNSNIVSVLLHQALDSLGNPIDGKYGIWIKWNCVITGNGLNASDTIKIK